MLKNQNIICFSSADWDNPLWTNKQHIMSRLSKENRILYIESLGLRRPVVSKRDGFRIIKRIKNCLKGVRKIRANLYVLSPLIIPLHDSKFIRKINMLILYLILKFCVRNYNLKNPVIWTYIPNIVDLLEKFDKKYVVYHCVDEISQFPGVTNKIMAMEVELLKQADIVFVTSITLYENKKKYNKNTFYLPNVADTKHFSKVLRAGIKMPVDIANIKKPILGFIGALDDYKIDSDLLRYIAGPQWNIVLIGPLGLTDRGKTLRDIISMDNIFYLGKKGYNILPNYLKYFDVCLIPMKINDYTANVFPMKFFEYLSAGKPVVSVRLPSLKEFQEYAYFADTKYEFKAMINKALEEDSEKMQNMRLNLAKENTWEKRIESMERLIETYIKNQ